MYLERLSVNGISDSKYYVPNGTFNTKPASSSLQMPNCTIYCYLRSHEFLNATERIKGIALKGSYGWHNAKYWYEETGLPTGTTLREGSIAVFDGTCGHVAFVERVIDSTHALITESNYDDNKNLRNWKYWRKREVELVVGKATLSGVGKLKGFIYLPIEDVDIRKERNSGKDQIRVTETFVNVRVAPQGDIAVTGCYCPMGIYDVKDISVQDDYTWYKIEENRWVAGVDCVEFLEKETTDEDPTVAELKKEVKELKTQVSSLEKEKKNLTAENAKLEKTIEADETKLSQITDKVKELVDIIE